MRQLESARTVALYPSRTKTGGLACLAALFVAIGCFMIAGDEVFPRIIGFLCVFFFGICFLYLAYRTMKRQPSLLIDDEGVTDNSSYIGGGRLTWQDIRAVRLYDYMGQRMIGLELHDPQALYDRQSGFKRLLLKANKGLVKPQVNIPQAGLALPIEQVYDLLLGRWLQVAEAELPGDDEEEGSDDEEEPDR